MLKHTEIGTRGKTHTTLSTGEQRAHVSAQINADVLHGMRIAVEAAIGKTSATMDIVNDAIVIMLEKADRFDWTKGSIGSWGMRIAANRARNWRKMACHAKAHHTEAMDDDGTLGDIFEVTADVEGVEARQRKIDAQALNAAIDSLDDDKDRLFLSWVAKEGVSQTAAGQLLGWSPATACRRMKEIARKTRDRFDGSF